MMEHRALWCRTKAPPLGIRQRYPATAGRDPRLFDWNVLLQGDVVVSLSRDIHTETGGLQVLQAVLNALLQLVVALGAMFKLLSQHKGSAGPTMPASPCLPDVL